jgi:hypothetical protein
MEIWPGRDSCKQSNSWRPSWRRNHKTFVSITESARPSSVSLRRSADHHAAEGLQDKSRSATWTGAQSACRSTRRPYPCLQARRRPSRRKKPRCANDLSPNSPKMPAGHSGQSLFCRKSHTSCDILRFPSGWRQTQFVTLCLRPRPLSRAPTSNRDGQFPTEVPLLNKCRVLNGMRTVLAGDVAVGGAL